MREKIRNEFVKALAGTKDMSVAIDDTMKIIEQEQIDNTFIRVHGEQGNEKLFEELARPLIKYLCENYHPHVTIIITPTSAELLEGLKSIGNVDDYIRD